jgi:2-succinyl-5-enolpyruvyl-6-hydroxy-3-cyclohexene-1-carboxylate synthase
MNRGANGIDGMASTAIGAALAWQRDGHGPALAYLGDIAALHDLQGFIIGNSPKPHLTFVVSDNDGGGIFSTLEQANSVGFERVLGTPHGLNLAEVLRSLGLPTVRADIADLPHIVGSPLMSAVIVKTLARDHEAAVRTALIEG